MPETPPPDAYEQAAFQRLGKSLRRGGSRTEKTPEAAEMRANRRVTMKKSAGSSAATAFATGRPRDPLFYWKQNNLPYETDDEAQLKQLRMYCRLLYQTHPIIASCIDIYTKYPLLGMELRCFAAETRVITEDGVQEISVLSGGAHTILTTGGKWVEAKFDEYGAQRLMKLTLRRNRREKVVYATPGHRWFTWEYFGPGRGMAGEKNPGNKLSLDQMWEIRDLYRTGKHTQQALAARYGVSQPRVGQIARASDERLSERPSKPVRLKNPVRKEVETQDLASGDVLVSVYPTHRVHSTNPSPFGIAHGMTFGDGALVTSGGGSSVDLHGEKDAQMLRFFSGCDTYEISQTCTRVTNLPAFFKDFPSITESQSYLYGWLAGYFAADGTVSKTGEMYLDSVFLENMEFARDVCTKLGIKTYEPYSYTASKRLPNGTIIDNWTGHRLPIDPASLTEKFFCIEVHRERWSGRIQRERREDWTVVSVEETNRFEAVYCAQVPETEAFALEGNILTGNCKDEKIAEFYREHFFTEDGLNYDDFLMDVGREYWTVGEAWPFATFNESLGIWDSEELLNPDDVTVQRSAFLPEPRFLIRLPETLREIIQRRSPAWEYEKIMKVYPELARYAGQDDMMPVSNVLLRQMKFKADTFAKRGIPILMRAMRAVMQEEMLNAAQDAVADRLYTPLVLVKLGASASDLGTSVPWIPSPDDLEDFMESLDAALAADFRALVHNFAVTMEPVFGRENMPDMSADFERLEDRILQSFGLSKTMLSGASSGETYAADAMNRDLVTQLMTKYQEMIKRHFHQRALVVAEAQEHYDYDERNGKRYVKMEEVLEIDEETGEERIVEQPKLLVPELIMQTMNLSDEQAEREFFEALRAAGVPISMKTRLMASGIDFEEEIERTQDEDVQLAVTEQETRKKIFQALKDKGLPIPADLRADFQPMAEQAQPPANPMMDMMRTPMLGTDPLVSTPTLAPTQMDLGNMMPAGGVAMPGMPATPVDGGDSSPFGQEGDTRPDESDEQRGGMPKPAALFRQSARTRAWARQKDTESIEGMPVGKFSSPKVIGARRHLEVDPETFFEQEFQEA